MKAAGIIAEFSPFHQGHDYLIRMVREKIGNDVLIVILSSWFTSRGLPSLMSVQTKTRMALQAGADLVIALPCCYAMQSADYFAKYAVEALHAAGVTSLYFGSEQNDLARLRDVAGKLAGQTKNPAVSRARHAAKIEALQPNDILAAQYILQSGSYGISCHPVLRDQSLASATRLRQDFFQGISHPEDASYQPDQNWEHYYPWLRYMLLESSPQTLSSFFLVEEGIENRLIEAAKTCRDWDAFLNACLSKTYSKARIQRTCMMILLQISKKDMKEHPSFSTLQVLGLNARGAAWLHALPETVEICSRFRQLPAFLQTIELKASRLYNLAGHTDFHWEVIYL